MTQTISDVAATSLFQHVYLLLSKMKCVVFHPSVYTIQAHGTVGAYPSLHGTRGWVHRKTNIQLISQICLWITVQTREPEENLIGTGKTCTLHAEGTQPGGGFNPWTTCSTATTMPATVFFWYM